MQVELKIIVGDDKVVISHNRVFFGKGYRNGSLFVLNLASETMNGNASSSAYIAKSIDMGHGRLGHINFASIKRLKNMRSIPTVNNDIFSKCHGCVEAKYVKKPFKLVTSRKTKLLTLVHSDLVHFKNTVSKGRKKYYITFVDDF